MRVCAVIAAVLIFHDRFGPINGVGLAIVIVGVVLFNLYKMKRAQVRHTHTHTKTHTHTTTVLAELPSLTHSSTGVHVHV